MISRIIKLKPTTKQEKILVGWLWNLTGVWNWGLRKIENDARDKIYHSSFDFQNILRGHSEKLGIPSHILQGSLSMIHLAWSKCFKKQSKKPHLKGSRNKLSSIPFPDPIKTPINCRISLLGIGPLRYHAQELPAGKIKCGRIVRRASGWYLVLFIDAEHKFPVQKSDRVVGVDPGFKTLLTLSTGEKIKNPREPHKGSRRLAQAQRGGNKKLSAHLQERQANRRRDRNHKISRKLVEENATIFYSADNFQKMAKRLGKSVAEASLGQLIQMLSYKCRTGGRTLIPVDSKFTTMTCSICGARSGPTGWSGLAVRHWDCACGAHLDRDINAARNILMAGLGMSHETEARYARPI